MPWDEANNRFLSLTGADEGFYLSHKVSLYIESRNRTSPENLPTCKIDHFRWFSSYEVASHACCSLSKGEARTSLSTSPTSASRLTPKALKSCSNAIGRCVWFNVCYCLYTQLTVKKTVVPPQIDRDVTKHWRHQQRQTHTAGTKYQIIANTSLVVVL